VFLLVYSSSLTILLLAALAWFIRLKVGTNSAWFIRLKVGTNFTPGSSAKMWAPVPLQVHQLKVGTISPPGSSG
jgi:hypothetical protein